MRYTLIATNAQGASVQYSCSTKKGVLNILKNEYGTSGFRITIIDNKAEKEFAIKTTYR